MIIVLRLRRESPKYLDLNVDLLILPIIAVRQDIFFFSPIILHMPLMVDLFYYQVLKIKQRQINITTVNFSHTLELPRHMSHLDIQVFHLMTMPMIKTEMGEKECLRLRETIYSSSLQSTNIIFYQ